MLNALLLAATLALPETTPVRAIYVNAWAFGTKKFYQLVHLAETTEVNSLVIDVKDDTGYLTYRSEVPIAIEIGANGQLRAPDARARMALLKAKGIHPIARIVVAKDPLLAAHKETWAIQNGSGGAWTDRKGTRWVDAFNDSVWVYAASLAAEAVKLGFEEIQYDYVRFPDESRERMAKAVFPARHGIESSREGIDRNLRLLATRTRALKVPFTIDVFGLTTTAEDDMGIGQFWEDLVSDADVVLPMVYPSHYRHGVYGVARPNSSPYIMVKRALEDGLRRSKALAPRRTAEIRPYLQAFTLGAPHYTPFHVREQVRALADLGITSWVLWNPRSVYDRGYFKSDSTPVPRSVGGSQQP